MVGLNRGGNLAKASCTMAVEYSQALRNKTITKDVNMKSWAFPLEKKCNQTNHIYFKGLFYFGGIH